MGEGKDAKDTRGRKVKREESREGGRVGEEREKKREVGKRERDEWKQMRKQVQ